MRNSLLRPLAAAAAILWTGVALAQPVTLRVGYAIARDSHFGDAVDTFARELDRSTGGRYRVEHLPAGKAGGELELVQQLRENKIEMVITSTGPVSTLVPEIRVLDLPFLFHSYGHAHRTLDGPVGKALLERFAPRGIQALAWAEHGFRHMTNNRRPIVYMDDLRDLRIRTMENPVHIATMKALRALPTPLPFPRLAEALKNGAVDGQENPVTVIMSSKLYEVQRYLSLTYHFYSAGLILMSPKTWAALPPADRPHVQAAALAAALATRRRVAMDEVAAMAELKRAGMQINVFVDGASFRLALRQQYLQLYPEVDRATLRAIQESW